MTEKILHTLQELRAYAIGKGVEMVIFYHEEDSTLMRFANSSISLNTNEHLIRLDMTAYTGRKRASYSLITDLDKLEEMKRGIDLAAEMVAFAQPLNYEPTIPQLGESFVDESGYDPELALLTNEERLVYFNQAANELETDEIRLSGIFSSGSSTVAQINTRSPHAQLFRFSDAQVTAVLSHSLLKWEVQSEQSAQRKSDLDPHRTHRELAFLLQHYLQDPAVRLPLGTYDIVFGPAAIADMVSFMNWVGFSGGSMKRGFSFLQPDRVGQTVFSEKITLADDPAQRETFPYRRDFSGIPRNRFPLFEKGVFQGFTWSQDDADEFGERATGHSVMHKSLVLQSGNAPFKNLEELVAMPRARDILYIPFLHYMNIVNPSKGVITGSSRFGALLLRADGAVAIPYNVRITQSLLDIFGEKVAWLSNTTLPYNTSMSYGARNPSAVVVPTYMQVNAIEISHSNESY